MLIELDKKIKRLYSWILFENEISVFSYIELAISEIGNTSDEDIEVNIELPANKYVNYEEFPEANINIVDEINQNYSNKLFKPYYCDNISEFRKKPLTTYNPHPFINPLIEKRTTEYIKGVYDYIDYEVLHNNNDILSFTIRNIKENETMVFPGKIIVKDDISEINYSIISKNSNKKIAGKLYVKSKGK